MKTIIVSDFDGTVTKQDSLYHFFEKYADKSWLEIEKLWQNGEIDSKECLTKQFNLVPELNAKLVDDYTGMIQIDEDFKEFNNFRIKNNIDFLIVSDGMDYFINKILQKNNIEKIKIISNHGEFKDDKFQISFPNEYSRCINNAGTCKCKVIADLKKQYEKIIYIGDGVSDYCVANKVDILYAKAKLLKYCKIKDITCIAFDSFKDISVSV